jgi:3-oxoadipate enol-lactonase
MPMPHAEFMHVRLHYRLDGKENLPLLVLFHSLGTDLTLWNDVVPALGVHYRILRYDLRGHGASGVPAWPYSIADLSHDLLELLELLKVGRCDLCGLSIGGQIAMWLGVNFPQKFARLILANTAAHIGTAEGWIERIAQVSANGLSSIADEAMGRGFTVRFRQAFGNRLAEMRNVLTSTSLEGYIGCCVALRDSDLTASLPLIAAPVLVISGASDPVTTTGDGRALAAPIPRASYVELNAAHLSAVEQPGAFSSAVLAFLDREGVQHGWTGAFRSGNVGA